MHSVTQKEGKSLSKTDTFLYSRHYGHVEEHKLVQSQVSLETNRDENQLHHASKHQAAQYKGIRHSDYYKIYVPMLSSHQPCAFATDHKLLLYRKSGLLGSTFLMTN